MFFFGRNKGLPKWEPVICPAADVIDLIAESVRIDAPLVRLNIRIGGKSHSVGVTSEYDRKKRAFINAVFYLDEQTFTSLEAFTENANVDGVRFAEIKELAVISDEDQGDPRINILLAEREKRYRGV